MKKSPKKPPVVKTMARSETCATLPLVRDGSCRCKTTSGKVKKLPKESCGLTAKIKPPKPIKLTPKVLRAHRPGKT